MQTGGKQGVFFCLRFEAQLLSIPIPLPACCQQRSLCPYPGCPTVRRFSICDQLGYQIWNRTRSSLRPLIMFFRYLSLQVMCDRAASRRQNRPAFEARERLADALMSTLVSTARGSCSTMDHNVPRALEVRKSAGSSSPYRHLIVLTFNAPGTCSVSTISFSAAVLEKCLTGPQHQQTGESLMPPLYRNGLDDRHGQLLLGKNSNHNKAMSIAQPQSLVNIMLESTSQTLPVALFHLVNR